MASLKVMSFNVRFDNPNEEPQDAWDARKGTCAAIIAKYRPHLLGLQEPHRHQCEQLASMLPNYGWYGTGRYVAIFGMNEKHNELNPVFYDKDALTLNESGTFWYSDTPAVPQTKWACSAFPRIATWARLTIKETGQMVCFINTHFDHESEEARTKAAELLVAQIPAVSKGLPTVVVGDLNCGEGSPALATLSGALIECSSAGCAVIDGMLGKCGTFVGFDKSIDSQIDFIFAAQGLKPAAYGTVPDECDNGRCCSDHRPVVAELTFEEGALHDVPVEAAAAAAEGGSGGGGGEADAAAEAAKAAAAAAKDIGKSLLKGAGEFFKKL